MKKLMSITIVLVLIMAFAFGAFVPATQAAAPKRCYYDCIGGHYLYCCMYAGPGGSVTKCTDTGYLCGW